MRIGRLLFTGVAAVVLVAPAHAQRETPPEGGEPRDFQLPAQRTYELANGLGVTLVPYGRLPKATVTLVVRAGNINETAQEVWLADLTGDMLQEGTTSRTAAQIAEEAAGMGGSLNIGVGMDQTTVGGDVLGEFAPQMVNLVADVVRNPSFPESELGRLKDDRVRQVSVALQQPRPITNAKFREVMYGDHPYGRLYPTQEQIRGYTLEQVENFHAENFGARRSHIYVVGRYDTGLVESAIQEAFGSWKEGSEPETKPANPRSGRELHLIDREGAAQSTIYMGLPVIDPSHEDFVPLQLTNTMLGGSFSSRITSNIREDKGYTYSPFSSVSIRYRDAYWVQVADVTTEHTGASLKEILYEVNRLQEEPPAQDELQGFQNYMSGTFVLQNSSRSGIRSVLSFVDLHGLSDEYLTNYVRNIHAVTPEEISRMTRMYLDPEQMLIVITGDRSEIEDQVAPYGALVN